MKQVIQSYKTGQVTLEEVPVPMCSRKSILVRNCHSLVSLGTEKSTIALGKKSLIGKARARPDLLKRAIEKAKTQGFKKTWIEAMGRLDTPTPLGYSAAGIVVETGTEAHGFSPGDRVACIGQGFASHAEFISVPITMAVKISAQVSTQAAAFGMLGCIALHGIRSANLTFGSTVGVIGLGLLGQLTVQMLKAYGCDVFAFDINVEKMQLAKQFGADITREKKDNVDAVIITAATDSAEPVDLGIEWCRPKGKIVVVGVADIHPDRNALWKKELELIVSKAAGPGSLDEYYEKHGVEYPVELARWSQNRNLQEFLRLLDQKLIQLDALITHQYAIDQAEKVYVDFLNNQLNNPIGVLFQYPAQSPVVRHVPLTDQKNNSIRKEVVTVSVIGAGIFGKSVFLPALSKNKNVRLNTLITHSGMNAQHVAKRFGFASCSTDVNVAFDTSTDAIIALTPHSQHASLVLKALQEKKALLIEKPLCVHPEELAEMKIVYETLSEPPVIMVGHNRRYSPHATQMKLWLSHRVNPAVMSYRVNAGFVSRDHWVHSDREGRSRIIGEMTHFIDFIQAVLNEKIVSVVAKSVTGNSTVIKNDNVIVTFSLDRGSIATLIYSAQGNRQCSREYMEIFFDGKTIVCDDFRETKLIADKKEKFKTREQALGYAQEIDAFVFALQNNCTRTSTFSEMIHTMESAFAIESALAGECRYIVQTPKYEPIASQSEPRT